MLMNSDRPILITGTPRSGKTMIAGVLEICGVFAGETDRMLENISVRDTVLRKYLLRQAADPNGLRPLPETKHLNIPGGWKEGIDNIMEKEGYKTEQRWMFKSSKIALTWPVWHYAYPEARYVIVRRRAGDIIQSCMKTDYMRAYEDEDGWKDMIHQYEGKLAEMLNEGLNCKVIWPHRMVNGDYSQIYELLDWLGLQWKTEILTHIDPKFWRTRKKHK